MHVRCTFCSIHGYYCCSFIHYLNSLGSWTSSARPAPEVAFDAAACDAALAALPAPQRRAAAPSLLLCWNPAPCDERWLIDTWGWSHYELVWRIHGSDEFRFFEARGPPPDGVFSRGPRDPRALFARIVCPASHVSAFNGDARVGIDVCVRCVSRFEEKERSGAGIGKRSMCTPLTSLYFPPLNEIGDRSSAAAARESPPRPSRSPPRRPRDRPVARVSSGGGHDLLRETLLSGSTLLSDARDDALSPRGDGRGVLPCVGQRVLCEGDGEEGRCVWVGTVPGRRGIWVGINLDYARGRHDGVFGRDPRTGEAIRLFACAARHGRFVRPHGVRVLV